MFKVSTKDYRRCDLVSVIGRVDASTAPQLEAALKKITREGRFRIVVDLSETEYMSAAGFRVLVASVKEVRRFNRGDVRLCGMSGKVKKTFELRGFQELFQVFDNETDAVASF